MSPWSLLSRRRPRPVSWPEAPSHCGPTLQAWLRILAVAACAPVLTAPLRAAPASASTATSIPLAQGLVFTVTSHTGLEVFCRGSLPIADTEIVYSVKSVDATSVTLQFALSAARDADAAKLLDQVPTQFERQVRWEDLRSATRESVLFASTDPTRVPPGQTFATASAAVLAQLHDAGKVEFVLGLYEPEQGLESIASLFGGLGFRGCQAQDSRDLGAPLVSGIMALLSSPARHYYRGTLTRVGVERFSVLLDGKRTTVPALHARGELRFRDKTITPEFWWLDDANNPLTLKWTIGRSYEVVTRIDRPLPETPAQARSGASQTLAASPLATALAGKDCRAELTGVYFTTGSARVLEASMPALQRLAAILVQHPDWKVTIEGHTDNIGSAQYNLDLSLRRAEAVRRVLIHRFGVPEKQLSAKGYGFTRPVESNDTDEGRAHNRRVEVKRACG